MIISYERVYSRKARGSESIDAIFHAGDAGAISFIKMDFS